MIVNCSGIPPSNVGIVMTAQVHSEVIYRWDEISREEIELIDMGSSCHDFIHFFLRVSEKMSFIVKTIIRLDFGSLWLSLYSCNLWIHWCRLSPFSQSMSRYSFIVYYRSVSSKVGSSTLIRSPIVSWLNSRHLNAQLSFRLLDEILKWVDILFV